MSKSYEDKLQSLRSRRAIPEDLRNTLKALHLSNDKAIYNYDTRGKTTNIKYALGSMEELSTEATQICIEEGERVKSRLNEGLQGTPFHTSFEYQGSVPLNIHIEFSSDIDILVLREDVLTYDPSGPRASTYTKTDIKSIDAIKTLRGHCEAILKTRYYAATVDTSGAKSISLSGGSLRRKVDIVPSNWYDTESYQATLDKSDRGVNVLDKNESKLIPNFPFKHIKEINNKNNLVKDGAKKVIRLLKSIKRDSDTDIDLSSYEIAGLVWHMPNSDLLRPKSLELSLIASAQKFLRHLIQNPTWGHSLQTPDKSRKIIETTKKIKAIEQLAVELDDLANNIAGELRPFSSLTFEVVQNELNNIQV